MPRFAGVPVEETTKKPRFAGKPVEQTAPETQQTSTAMDMLQSAGAGIRRGIEGLGGMAGDLNELGGKGASWLAGKLGAGPETAETVGNVAKRMSVFGAMPRSDQVAAQTDELAGDALKHDPQTTAGEYARTIGEFAPAALAGPGGLVRRGITQALLPALGSETGGQLTEGTAAEPYARIAGALVGGIAPALAGRVISPFRASPERIQMADTLANEGIDLTAGQRTGSNTLRNMESELGGMAGQRMMEQQGEQFTSAALRRAGINETRASPEVIDQAFGRIGQQFDDLAARNHMVADQQLVGDLRATINEYGSLVPETARAPVIENITNDIVTAVRQHGGIPGDSYQALRSRLDRMARGARADPQLSDTLRGIRTALDDAMERSIQANNPGDAGAWQQVRNEYRNILVLEQAATGAGENAAAGLISPSQLRNATVTKHGRRNYARGDGDFAELARAGEGVMKPLPNSGTAGRTAARNVGTGMTSILAALAGQHVGGGPGMVAGMLAGSAVPSAIGRAILSGPGRAFLSNQLGSALPTNDPRMAAIVAALFANPERRAIAP